MAAIVELIAALFFELFEKMLRLAVFAIELGVRVIVSLFLWLTRGHADAGEYYRAHKPVLLQPSDSSFPSHTPPGKPIPVRRIHPIYGWLVLLVIVAAAGGALLYEQIQSAREQQTKQQIRLLVKNLTIALRDKEPEVNDLATGPLLHRDAWQRPLEVLVDRWPIGKLVVVRSAGRDGQFGTADDLLAADGIAPVGVPGFLKDAIKQRLPRVLKNLDLDNLPIDWVFED
jgi:hypothetical protein